MISCLFRLSKHWLGRYLNFGQGCTQHSLNPILGQQRSHMNGLAHVRNTFSKFPRPKKSDHNVKCSSFIALKSSSCTITPQLTHWHICAILAEVSIPSRQTSGSGQAARRAHRTAETWQLLKHNPTERSMKPARSVNQNSSWLRLIYVKDMWMSWVCSTICRKQSRNVETLALN